MKLKLTLFLAVVASVVTALTIAPAASSAKPVTATASLTGTVTSVAGTATGAVPAATPGQPLTLGLSNLVFSVVNGALQVTGNVVNPATGAVLGTFTTAITQAQPTGSCTILDLTLGPLHLNLLGLVVDLNQVHLTITGQTGPGNLLGNLLCGIAHLLDNTNGLSAVANLLNNLLGNL